MEIVALAPHLNPVEGWATVPANVVPHLSEEHDVTVLTGRETEPEWAGRYECTVEPIIPEPGDARHVPDIFRAAWKIRPKLLDADLVHTFVSFPYAPMARLALLGSATPLYVTALGTYAVQPLDYHRRRWLLASGYRRAESVLCISEYTRDRITAKVPLDNTEVLPLGVDVEKFDRPDPTDEPYILVVGAIKRRKGQDTAIEAFARIAEDFPDVTLKLAGPVHQQSFQRQVEQIAEAEGIEDRIEFLGKVSEEQLKELYAGCRFFLLTPRVTEGSFEGSGLVYLEAAAYGKPSVGTRSGGVPTSIDHRETGLLAAEEDEDGVAEAMRELLANPQRRQAYGSAARDRVNAQTWEWYAGELLSRFEAERI